MNKPKLSSQLFDIDKFEAYGYEVKVYHMKDAGLSDKFKITPLDLYHPELTFLQGELTILYQGSFFVPDIDKMHECLEDVKKLNIELKRRFCDCQASDNQPITS